ncbi:MAG: immunoglobulin domain-containing protein, partial [Verrucomicrobiota bacterium]
MKFPNNQLTKKDAGQTKQPINFHSVKTWLAVLIALLVMVNTCLAQTQGGAVIVGGNNTYGQTNVPSDLTDALAVASGSVYCLALRTNGTVEGWGYNVHGETKPPSGLTNVVAMSAATYHAMALTSVGTVVAWGDNDGNATNVPNGLTNVISIAAGGYNGNEDFSLAAKSDGSVVGWGGYAFGGAQRTPASLTNVVAVSAGITEGVALRNDGTVTAWTYMLNTYGQTNVPPGLSNVVAIAAGSFHTLVLKMDGTCVAWGANGSGQTNIPVGLSNVVAIAAAPDNSFTPDNGGYCMALKNDGTLVVWGSVTNEPVTNNVIALAAGSWQTMIITNNGAPAITIQPWNQKNYAGYSTFMFANAVGVQPMVYQWQLNGSNVEGATNLLLNLTNIQPADGGNYILIASNNLGFAASAAATLTVVTNIPLFTVQPTNQTIYAGYNASFSAAVGSGPIPYWFQWQFNGTNISDATNSILILTNVQPSNQGNYTAIFNNNFGSATSSNALLNVLTNAPAIIVQPTNQTVIAGSNIIFSVAIGAGPIPNTFQWQFNGTNILDATNLALTLTNVQTTNQGNYSVAVNNGYGTTSSSNAYLTVIVLDLPTALNTPGWTWANSGTAPWFPELITSLDGKAAQSGLVANGQATTRQTTVTGPGTLTFWWMFSPLTSPF